MFDEARRQSALDALQILDTPPDERIDRVTRLAREVFGVPMVSVTLIDRDRQWRKSELGLGGREAPRDGAFCDVAMRHDGTMVVADASIDSRFAENPFVTGNPHLRFYAGHPLLAPSGDPVGTFCILDTEPREMTGEQQELLEELASWVQAELIRAEDIDQATIVQRALQPRTLAPLDGYRMAAGARPAGDLMGDFYDLRVQDGRLRVALADVMGKGTGPAILAASIRASLRTVPGRGLLDGMAEVDRILGEDVGDLSIFVTGVVAELEPDTGALTYVDAGHGLAYILRADDRWERLSVTGLPLGMDMDAERVETGAVLEPGDIFMVCSDGLLDVLDEANPLEHVRRVIRANGPQGAVDEALRLALAVRASDDVTTVVVERLA